MCYDWLCGVAGGGKVYEPELAFKKKGRGCTDLLGLIIYIASWIAIIVIISTAGGKGGNPHKIIHGVDWEGKICGKDGGVMDRPFVAWPYVPLAGDAITNKPNLDEFINVRVCLQSCAETEGNSTYMMRNYKSREFIYYCVPDSAALAAAGNDLAENLDDASNSSEREIASLLTVWPALLASAGIALLLTFAYNFLTRYIAGFIVWLALILLTVGGFLTSYVLLKTAGDVNHDSPSIRNRAKLMRGFGWTVAAVTLIALIIFFALRKRMYIAIETIKEASRAVDDMKSLTIWPFFPLVFALGYITFFIATAMFIISVTTSQPTPLPSFMYADPSTKQVECVQNNCIWNNPAIFKGNYSDISWDTSMKHSFVYAFFHLLWSTQFIIYFNYIVIAGAIAGWYFSYRNDDGKKIRGDGEGELAYNPVLSAVWRVIRYNLGTLAIAALIIAIIKFIRACVIFIEKKLQAKGEPNRLQRCMFCMIHCCLKCVECCCDKINKNLLIWNAIYGHNFASSACSSFALVWANLGRIAALNLVGEFIMFVGKVVVALLTTGIAGLIIYAKWRSEIESPTLPLAICFIIGYVVASMFMLIFEVAIDAVFICFLIDEKLNAGAGKMFASPGLKEIVEKHAETSKEVAQQQNAQLTQRQSFYKKGGMTEAGANYN